jgi:hypothetical protein
MTVGEYMFIEEDTEYSMVFFYCTLCPLTLPFLKAHTAVIYSQGHTLNKYHQRRLELQR